MGTPRLVGYRGAHNFAAADINHQLLVTLGSGAAQLRAALTRGVTSITRRGNLQHLVDRLDPIGVAVTINELSQDLNRRSSSA